MKITIKGTFNKNIIIENIYFFNHIVLIRKRKLFFQIHNLFKARPFMVHSCTESVFASVLICLKWGDNG